MIHANRCFLTASVLLLLTAAPLHANTSLKGVTPPLVEKIRELQKECGVKIVSTISRRPNRSNHPRGKAVDVVGNPSCVYANLKRTRWKGGYSTDYSAVRHVHISYNPGGQEWGQRFAHGYGKHRRHHVTVAASAYPPKERY